MDVVVGVDRLPLPGETVLGSPYQKFSGGKGGNQAVAAAKAGGSTAFAGCVGTDEWGEQLRQGLQAAKVDIAGINIVEGPSGIALIVVDDRGQNSIVVSPGANVQMLPHRLSRTAIATADVLLLQLEIPLETVTEAIDIATSHGTAVVLNPAPAQPLKAELLAKVDYLVVNESEAALLTGRPTDSIRDRASALIAVQHLTDRGVGAAIITLGAQGVAWFDGSSAGYLPALAVEVVDSTAAGDAFCGALAVKLGERARLQEAIAFANAAGAVAVTRMGAQASLGDRVKIETLLSNNPQ